KGAKPPMKKRVEVRDLVSKPQDWAELYVQAVTPIDEDRKWRLYPRPGVSIDVLAKRLDQELFGPEHKHSLRFLQKSMGLYHEIVVRRRWDYMEVRIRRQTQVM